MAEAFLRRAGLAFGANLGDRAAAIKRAMQLVGARAGRISSVSSLWRTKPWGMKNQPDFFNACAVIDTPLSPHDLLRVLQNIEAELGRVRYERWGPRVIDIDIIFVRNVVFSEKNLIIPHEHAQNRAFVLAPMAEIAPDENLGGATVSELLALRDLSDVERIAAIEL